MTMKNRLKFFLLLIIAVNLISCDKEENEFESINLDSDWHLNDEFSHNERKLFDTLDFTRTASYQLVESDYIQNSPKITFYPNPFKDVGFLHYNTAPIIHIVIVNNSYEKILEARLENSYTIGFNLTEKKSGIYKLYYVIQDSNYNIVQLGHGFIKKE